MDSVGHGATRHPTKIHRKEDGQVTKKGNGKGTQKGGKSKEGIGGNQGKRKGKGKIGNVSTKSQNLQKNSGQVER